jgi:hypothetical protein
MRQAMQFNPANNRGFVTDKPFRGQNPTFGLPISYYLKGATPQAQVALRIRDASGTVVRELSGNEVRDATNAGINRVHWDLRYAPLPPAPGQPQGGGGGGGFAQQANNGPFVLPGEYRVTLVVGGKEIATKSARVIGDMAARMTDADRKAWHDTALALHRLQQQANQAAEAISTLGTQHQTLEGLFKMASNAPADAKSAIEATGKQLTELRRRFGVPAPGQAPAAGGGGGGGFGGGPSPNIRQQLGATKGQIMNSHSAPSAQQTRVLTEGREDLAKLIAETNSVITAIPGLFEKLGAGGVKPAALKPVPGVQ